MTKNYTPLKVIPQKVDKNDLITLENEGIEVGKTQELAFIKKKKEYRQFLTMCREGKVATAVITAKALGVDRNTITSWFQTPQAKKALQMSTNKYVESIEQSKDWKAHQWLLQQQTQQEEETQSSGVTNQILIMDKEGQFSIMKNKK